jgi:prevent-host-death family protein
MKQQISLREANQHLSKYIEAVERGDEIIITKRGKPVAKLVGADMPAELNPEQEEALEALFGLGMKTEGRTYRREEIYEERLAELENRRNRQR